MRGRRAKTELVTKRRPRRAAQAFDTTFARMIRVAALVLAGSVAVAAGAGCAPSPGDLRALTVFAAASLRDVIDEIAEAFSEESGIEVVRNYAGSNVLARQIRATDEADVYLSANENWMDHVAEAGRIVEGSRRAFLSNRLVIVTHHDSRLEIEGPDDLTGPDVDLVSLADPEAVPAGRYAREWLQARPRPGGSSVWDVLEDRVAPAPDVRAALALVEADPSVPGIVYRTDAAASDRVRVHYEVAGVEEPRVRYVAARIEGGASPAAADAFLAYLAGPDAAAVFERAGFVTVETEATDRRMPNEVPR